MSILGIGVCTGSYQPLGLEDLEEGRADFEHPPTNKKWSLLSKAGVVLSAGAGIALVSYLARSLLSPFFEEMGGAEPMVTAVATTVVAARHLLSEITSELVFHNFSATEETPFERSWLESD